jgi:hypothetical protein
MVGNDPTGLTLPGDGSNLPDDQQIVVRLADFTE